MPCLLDRLIVSLGLSVFVLSSFYPSSFPLLTCIYIKYITNQRACPYIFIYLYQDDTNIASNGVVIMSDIEVNGSKQIQIKCKGHTSLPYTKLVPFQGDLKDLSKENYNKLKKSILELGFSEPCSVWLDDGVYKVLNAHQRVRVVKQMVEIEGYSCPDLPVNLIEADSIKEAKKKVLAFTSQFGEITNDGLFGFMTDAGLDMAWAKESLRFPEISFDKFEDSFFESEVPGENDVQEPKDSDSRVSRGDLFILGNHRLLCGDSVNTQDIESLMDGKLGDLLLTDPPYGVSYIEKNDAVHGGIVKNAVGKQITNDSGTVEEMGKLWADMFSHADFFTNEASYYVFSPQGGELMMMMQAIHQSKWQLKHSLIWQKQNFVFGRCDYHYQHEPVLFGWKKKGKHNWYADRSQSSLLQFDKPHKSDLHPTTKPVDILEYLIGNSSKENDIVVDLFGGSGSTMIACEKKSRAAYLCEIDPSYCAVILDRWTKFTGRDPVRESDGQLWSSIKSS